MSESRVPVHRLLGLVVVVAGAVAPSARAEVDFARDVHSILAKKCFGCHSTDIQQGGLSLVARDALLEGGAHGPAVTPREPGASLLYQRILGQGGPRMPMGMPPLTAEETETVRAWIAEGAAWNETSEGPLRATAPLGPRPVAVPSGSASHPIDRFLARYFRVHGVNEPETVSDAVFLRRAYLDLWGFLPPPDVHDAFVRDAAADKRAALIDKLLADDKLYSEHWITYWNDLLRNDEGVVYHGGRESITGWLFSALGRNMPYDEMVRELLSPVGEDAPDGFLIGVNWRGVVNASQTPPVQAAQNSAQVFLGINLKCASCHDSFVNQWKLADSYGLASFFADEPLELVRCDAPLGRKAEIKFLFPELGNVVGSATLAERRAAAARMFTAPENGRFPRTIVNRFWQQLLGRGLVEPADDMDLAAWDTDLLDWLANDFAGNGYDLKHLIRRIMTSRAYQAAAAPAIEDREDYVFRGPEERRMSAEQFADSLSALTGEWAVREHGKSAEWSRDWRIKATPLARALGRPARDQVFTNRNENATTLQALELLNGETLTRRLHRGAQRLLGRLPEAPVALWDSGVLNGRSGKDRPSYAEFDIDVSHSQKLYLLARDSDSYDPTRVIAGWAATRLVSGGAERPIVPPDSPHIQPIAYQESADESAVAGGIPARLVVPTRGAARLQGRATIEKNTVHSEINPRVRFFVFDQEPDLERLVTPRGPAPILYVPPPLPEQPETAVSELFRRALAREPSQGEMAIALELLGARGGTIPTEGLEDLLWSLALLPEFQVIR